MSLTIKEDEEERDEEAKSHGPYTYDVYTAKDHTPHDEMGQRQAVGLVDGVAAADTGFVGAEAAASIKSVREAAFPAALVDKGMRARVQDGKASVEADWRHILNSIAKRPLDAEVAAEHEAYEAVNAILHGRVAADGLRAAIEAGGETLERALAALAASRVTRVGVNLIGCMQATEGVMARVAAALPTSLFRS